MCLGATFDLINRPIEALEKAAGHVDIVERLKEIACAFLASISDSTLSNTHSKMRYIGTQFQESLGEGQSNLIKIGNIYLLVVLMMQKLQQEAISYGLLEHIMKSLISNDASPCAAPRSNYVS